MSVQSTTHLNFRDEARAALNFYQTVFGGKLMIVTYGDLGHVPTPAETDHVVWGQVAAPSGFRVMAY
ncbi:VOC family protein, partial [bacterium]